MTQNQEHGFVIVTVILLEIVGKTIDLCFGAGIRESNLAGGDRLLLNAIQPDGNAPHGSGGLAVPWSYHGETSRGLSV